MVIAHGPAEGEFRTDVAIARAATDAQPFVTGGGDDAFVPDIVAGFPVAVLVEEVRKFP